tara:strand:+ start:468 stop:683 length:216 start_codon:yes stop_codon:yes gene_type:complete
MNQRKLMANVVLLGELVARAVYASFFGSHMSPAFYVGHTHGADGEAIGAPSHSGGTNAAGCHNKSVPYHCH